MLSALWWTTRWSLTLMQNGDPTVGHRIYPTQLVQSETVEDEKSSRFHFVRACIEISGQIRHPTLWPKSGTQKTLMLQNTYKPIYQSAPGSQIVPWSVQWGLLSLTWKWQISQISQEVPSSIKYRCLFNMYYGFRGSPRGVIVDIIFKAETWSTHSDFTAWISQWRGTCLQGLYVVVWRGAASGCVTNPSDLRYTKRETGRKLPWIKGSTNTEQRSAKAT